jgi:MoaA/NifB/PqqE/SkfB family radical SAM enzyme
MSKLIDAFNPETLSALMCRQLVNVGPDGRVYDCDFNQALQLPVRGLEDRFIWDLELSALVDRDIVTGDHCYGCAAGAGSSCAGTLV